MTPERWREVFAVLDGALERSAAERPGFLTEACAGDPDLRREVEELISSYEEAGTFIDDPAVWIDFTLGERAAAGPPAAGPPATDSPAGGAAGETRIGGYRVLRTLGRGGMGAVYLATRADEEYEQLVAVKVLQDGLTSGEMVHRFLSERQILANLDHPHIAKLLDGGTTGDGRPYLVMEYVDGVPIDRFCDARELATRARLELFCEVCRAVHFAHQNLVVHRDLKPRNILISEDGEPKLLDFGIAKLLAPEAFPRTVLPTRTGLMPMTPEYASPEQVRGGAITTASDVYSLGVLLYELLTGRRPYRLHSRDPLEVARAICEEEPQKPSTAAREPSSRGSDATTLGAGGAEAVVEGAAERKRRRRLAGDLDNIVLMALAKEPDRRYGSAEQLAQDLERHLRGLPVRARKDTLAYRAGKFVGRHKLAVAATAAVFVLLLGLVLALLVQNDRIQQERSRAQTVSEFLVEMFAKVDPARARGREVTAQDLLDTGAREIDRELGDQPEVRAALMETMGRSYLGLGLLPEAESLLESALALRREIDSADGAGVASSLESLADLRTVQGDYGRAVELHRESLALRRRHAEDSEDVARSHLRLAHAFEFQSRYDAAEPHLQQALEISRRLGRDELRAKILDRYGLLHKERVSYDESETRYRQALAIYRDLFPGPHPRTANVLNNLAGVLLQKDDYAGAEALYREAAAMQRTLFEGPHHDLAQTLGNLAETLRRLGRYDEAGELIDEVLEMQRQVYGGGHPKLATTLMDQANLRKDLGDAGGAEGLYRQALDMRREFLGDDHPDTAASRGALASMLAGRGETEAAEAMFRQALEVNLRHLGEAHPRVGTMLNNLAGLAYRRGDLPAAEELFRRALENHLEAYGPEHSKVAGIQFNLARVLDAEGKHRAAETEYLAAIATVRRSLGERHAQVGMFLASLADMKLRLEEYGAAAEMARDALAILEPALPAEHSWSLAARRVLGIGLLEQGEYAAAEPVLVEHHRLLLAKRGADAATTGRAAERLVTLYEAWQRPEKAAEYRARRSSAEPD